MVEGDDFFIVATLPLGHQFSHDSDVGSDDFYWFFLTFWIPCVLTFKVFFSQKFLSYLFYIYLFQQSYNPPLFVVLL